MGGETPKLKTISCPNCGSPLSIRGLGFTNTLICSSCAATIDISTDEYKLLREAEDSKYKRNPIIPLGMRGTFFGDTFEVIGFMVRKTTNQWGTFEWEEYLLFNPYKGFRWLTQSDGHWSLVRMLKQKIFPGSSTTTFENESYKFFSRDNAWVDFVLGEFYWEVKVGDKATLYDYIDPPLILSYERTDSEMSWSQGVYLSDKEMRSAFPQVTRFPWRQGVGSNQPFTQSQWKFHFTALCCVIIAFLLHNYYMSGMHPATLYSQTIYYTPPIASDPLAPKEATNTSTTSQFTLNEDSKNLVVRTNLQSANQWIESDATLVNASTGEKIEGVAEMSYYEGYEGGEHWSEGSYSGEIWFPHVAAGNYYFAIDSSSDVKTPIAYSFVIDRDRSFSGNFILALFLILLVPGCVFLRQRMFEKNRWENSSLATGED